MGNGLEPTSGWSSSMMPGDGSSTMLGLVSCLLRRPDMPDSFLGLPMGAADNDIERPKLLALLELSLLIMVEAEVEVVEAALRLVISRICCFSSLRFDLMSPALEAKAGGELDVGLDMSRRLRPLMSLLPPAASCMAFIWEKLRFEDAVAVELPLEDVDDILEANVALGDEIGLNAELLLFPLMLGLGVGEGEDTFEVDPGDRYLFANGLQLG
jgi:hypothetical protein